MSQPSPLARGEASGARYDDDFFEWTRDTAALLRAGRLDAVDVAHVAEEVEDMGKRDLREVNRRVQVLLMHLSKWRTQPAKRTPSWRRTIVTQRVAIEALLRDSPSLRPRIAADLEQNHARALRRAQLETGATEGEFPARCPFTIEQLAEETFFPG